MDNYKQYYYMWLSLMGEMAIEAKKTSENAENLRYNYEASKDVLVRMAQMQAAYILEV